MSSRSQNLILLETIGTETLRVKPTSCQQVIHIRSSEPLGRPGL